MNIFFKAALATTMTLAYGMAAATVLFVPTLGALALFS